MYFACILDESFMYIEYSYFSSPPNLTLILIPVIIMHNLRILLNTANRYLIKANYFAHFRNRGFKITIYGSYSGELRPGSKPSSFAHVKTANISVSACSVQLSAK